MPPTFFGCLPRQKIDQKRHLSSRLSRIHFCDLIHGGGLVFGLHAIVASPAGRDPLPIEARHQPGLFQLTRPLRDATVYKDVPIDRQVFLPTRPLRDATLISPVYTHFNSVSTHASLAGRDHRRE